MKVEVTIKEITKDDLVNLFSTGLTGSSFLGCDYDKKAYQSLPDASEDDCIEDKLAKLLLAGHSIELLDMEAGPEDHYGNIESHYRNDYGCIAYKITLEDVKKGLQNAASNEDTADYFNDLLNDDAYNLDLTGGESLLQFIMFNEVIYG